MRARQILGALTEPCVAFLRLCCLARPPFSLSFAAGLSSAAALCLGGCAQSPPQRLASSHSKEYFSSSIWGPASPRVVADGEPVPRGGGIYMVGNPYMVAGHTYYPSEKRYAAVGVASWYGDAFHGRRTANGEIYDRDAITAAHPTMPLPSYARVTNLRNHYSMIVRVNDRGPFTDNRIMDVSRKTAEVLKFGDRGTTPVKVEYICPAELEGSDDLSLLATLRSNGPAYLQSTLARNFNAPAKKDVTAMAGDMDKPEAIAPDSAESDSKPAARRIPFLARPVPLPPPRPIVSRTRTAARVATAIR